MLSIKDKAGAAVPYTQFSFDTNSVEHIETGASSILSTIRAILSRVIPGDRAAGVYRTKGKMTMPVLGTDGVLLGTLTGTFEILRPAKLSNDTVEDFHARFKSLVADPAVLQMAKNGQLTIE